MEHLYLNNKYVYLRLQSLMWYTNALSRKGKLLDSAAEVLINIVDNVEPNKILVVNCKRVTDFGHNLFEIVLTKERVSKRKIIFIETDGIFTTLTSAINSLGISLFQNFDLKVVSPFNSSVSLSEKEYSEIIVEVEEEELNEINRIIIDSYNEFPTKTSDDFPDGYRPLPSTAILAQGEFNACSIISSPKKFLWLSSYMADKVDEFIQEKVKPTKILRLLGVSLRGAIFTSSVALLLGYEFDTVDHLGPKHKLYDVDFFETKINKYQYLYIGDFIIGGTEVKIAKTYAQIYGNTLEHAFVIGSLFEPERFSTFQLDYLAKIMEVIPKSKKIDYKLYLKKKTTSK